jgi:hypothetical protein
MAARRESRPALWSRLFFVRAGTGDLVAGRVVFFDYANVTKIAGAWESRMQIKIVGACMRRGGFGFENVGVTWSVLMRIAGTAFTQTNPPARSGDRMRIEGLRGGNLVPANRAAR